MMDDPKDAPSDDSIFDAAAERAEAAAAPAPEAAPFTATPTPEPAPGQPRDEKGRFATPSAPVDGAAAAPEATPPAPAPTTATSPTDTPAAAASEDAASPSDLSAYPPFQYRALDTDHTLPGTHVGEDGVLFTNAEGVPALRRLLAQAHENRQRAADIGRRVEGQVRESRRIKDAAEAQARQNADVMRALIQVGTDPDRLAEWAADAAGNMEKLKLRAELEVERQQRQAIEQDRQREMTERQRQERDSALPRQIAGVLQSYQQRPEFAGFDIQRVYERVTGPLYRSVFDEATQDDVDNGLAQQVGEVMVNYDVLEQVLRWDRPSGAPTKPAPAAPSAATTAAAAPPPVVSATQAPPPKAAPPRPDLRGKKAKDVDEFIFGEGLEQALSR